MAKPRPTKRTGKHAVATADQLPTTPDAADEQISYSSLPLHDLFQQQTREMLDRSDLDEEQKQSILVAMSCPCCGAGGMSYTVKLKR
jgi:hypothetical protein